MRCGKQHEGRGVAAAALLTGTTNTSPLPAAHCDIDRDLSRSAVSNSMCVRQSPQKLIRKASPGRGRDSILDLTPAERERLDEVSDLEIRLARIRNAIIGQVRARSQPPRNQQIRACLR
jgi:hypothetical protein